jgi:hypothetical protein
LRSRFAPPLSTGTPTTAETIFIQSRTGIKLSRTMSSQPCRS